MIYGVEKTESKNGHCLRRLLENLRLKFKLSRVEGIYKE